MSTVILESESTHVVFKRKDEVDSEEVSVSEWSSLAEELPEENVKRRLKAVGLYDPGSADIYTKYIAMSASSILRHPFYNYPAVLDPGIEEALLEPEEKVLYPNDGRKLYFAICNERDQCPVKTFYEGLLAKAIDLSYYCVNPYGVKAMAKALECNRNVTVLDFTGNFLNDDACLHLSDMLVKNTVLKDLNLTGCRIGPSGVKHLMVGLHMNRFLRYLNLSKNQIGDEGIKCIAESIVRGLDIPRLNLSNNNLTGVAANILTEALEISNKFSHLDLSWNNLSILPQGLFHLLFQMSESDCLEELNLAWNALCGVRIGNAIKSVMSAANLKKVDISNNRLADEAVSIIAESLQDAKSLITLDLSYNPLTVNDSFKIISTLQSSGANVRNVLMKNVPVNRKFLRRLENIKELKEYLVVTYGDVLGNFKVVEPDLRDIVLNRVDFLMKKRKKRSSVDIALVALQLLKDNRKFMTAKDFATAIENSGMVLEEELVNEIIEVFPGPKSKKAKIIDINLLVDFVKRKWPDRKLPPTPPSEPEIDPEFVNQLNQLSVKKKRK